MGLSPAAPSGNSSRNPGNETFVRRDACLYPSSRGVADGSPLSSVFVVLARAVGRRVLVRLPDALDPVDFLDVLCDDRRHEGLPVLSLQHSMANRGAGKSLAVQEGWREHLQVVFPKQADDQVGIRIHDVETRDKGGR